MTKENVVLSGRNVFSQLQMIDKGESGRPDPDKNGDPIWRMSYGGRGFTVREDVYKDFMAGNISDFTLAPNQYERPEVDENGVETGNSVTIDGWQYAGHLTYTQATNIEKNEIRLKLARVAVAKELDITPEELSAAL